MSIIKMTLGYLRDPSRVNNGQEQNYAVLEGPMYNDFDITFSSAVLVEQCGGPASTQSTSCSIPIKARNLLCFYIAPAMHTDHSGLFCSLQPTPLSHVPVQATVDCILS